MKQIEITTSQNVTVQYGLATVWERAIALVLDLLIMGGTFLVLWGIQALFIPISFDLFLYFVIAPFILLYSLVSEQINNGQSLGKRVLNIRVIRMDGEKINFLDYLMRWMFRGLDIYLSSGGVAILSITASDHNQRLGDLLANTVVVNVAKTERLRLENLLKLNKMDDYKVSFPGVIKMPEEAMLIVKETLNKNRQISNAAHEKALELLSSKMVKELGLTKPKNNEAFLKTLLRDYILLTR